MRSVSVLSFASFHFLFLVLTPCGWGRGRGRAARRPGCTRAGTRAHLRGGEALKSAGTCLLYHPPRRTRRCPTGACSPIKGSVWRVGVEGRAAGPSRMAEPGRRAVHFPPERQASSSRTCGLAAVCRISWKLGPPPGWSGERKTPVWVGDTSTQTKKGECGVLQRGPTDPVKVRREAGAWRHRPGWVWRSPRLTGTALV